jgi:tetrapyrrole methylase family protein/MazG family protein
MSVAARDALRAATLLILRTEVHPAAHELRSAGISFETFDHLYQSADSFDALYDEICDRVLQCAREGDVSYAVPGHPLVAEESVRRLLIRAREAGVAIRIAGSSSFIEPVLVALQLTLDDGLTLLDALSLDHIPPRTETGLLLYQVCDAQAAANVKLALLEYYPPEFEVQVVRSAGDAERQQVEIVPLHRLDRTHVDHLTSVYVPPLPAEMRQKSFSDLVTVMARLRGEGGCPWDREQDHMTLRRYMIEECYEAIEAIDAGDMEALEEELGDVLLQVVFHAQLEAETGAFTIDDVIQRIVEKLIRRHPHVFGDLNVEDSAEVLRNWEKIKKSEKGDDWRQSVLDGVPAQLPALMRALEISKRAVKFGFEWERMEDVLAKLEEEVCELKDALSRNDSNATADEIGDLLFTIVNVARWRKIDPEDALRNMLKRFTRRFHYIEEASRTKGHPLEEMSLAEMDALWDEAKAQPQE